MYRFREAVQPYEVLGATMTPSGFCAHANLVAPPYQISPSTTTAPGPVQPQEVTEGMIMMMIVIIVII